MLPVCPLRCSAAPVSPLLQDTLEPVATCSQGAVTDYSQRTGFRDGGVHPRVKHYWIKERHTFEGCIANRVQGSEQWPVVRQ